MHEIKKTHGLLSLKNCCRSKIEIRPTALLRYHAYTCTRRTLTFDLDLCPWFSIPGELWPWPTHTQTQVQRSVGSNDWVETNGRTDRHYRLLYPRV